MSPSRKKWNSSLKLLKQSKIKKCSKWIPIKNIKKSKTWKNCSGVYIFANKLKCVKYVGYSKNKVKNEALSAIKQRNKNRGATIALWIQCKCTKFSKRLENELKHFYDPCNNKL